MPIRLLLQRSRPGWSRNDLLSLRDTARRVGKRTGGIEPPKRRANGRGERRSRGAHEHDGDERGASSVGGPLEPASWGRSADGRRLGEPVAAARCRLSGRARWVGRAPRSGRAAEGTRGDPRLRPSASGQEWRDHGDASPRWQGEKCAPHRVRRWVERSCAVSSHGSSGLPSRITRKRSADLSSFWHGLRWPARSRREDAQHSSTGIGTTRSPSGCASFPPRDGSVGGALMVASGLACRVARLRLTQEYR